MYDRWFAETVVLFQGRKCRFKSLLQSTCSFWMCWKQKHKVTDLSGLETTECSVTMFVSSDIQRTACAHLRIYRWEGDEHQDTFYIFIESFKYIISDSDSVHFTCKISLTTAFQCSENLMNVSFVRLDIKQI